MAEMKAMEFTDELNLQPVRRPVPEPQAGEILILAKSQGTYVIATSSKANIDFLAAWSQ